MHIKIYLLPLLLITLFVVNPAAAQTEDKSPKEAWKDLKKSLRPDKNFIMPFTDSTNEDLKAFLFAVKETKGVKNAWIKIENKKVVLVVEAKGSLAGIWNNLDKEMRNRYILAERTPNGFVLTDSYQPAAGPAKN